VCGQFLAWRNLAANLSFALFFSFFTRSFFLILPPPTPTTGHTLPPSSSSSSSPSSFLSSPSAMSASQSPIFRLDCKAQSYDWGKIGSSSKVARFAACSPAFTVHEDRPYAEVWPPRVPEFHVHPRLPAQSHDNLASPLSKDVTILRREYVRVDPTLTHLPHFMTFGI